MNSHAAIATTLALGLAACLPMKGSLHRSPDRDISETSPRPVEAHSCGNIERIHRSGDILLTSQPSAEDLVAARDEGVRTVVNLRYEEEETALQNEARLVRKLGMKYIHLPWEGGEDLTFELINEMVCLLKDERRPILIHCDEYANRVGAAWLAYRVVEEGVDIETATAEARTVGLRSADYESLARDYAMTYGRQTPATAPPEE